MKTARPLGALDGGLVAAAVITATGAVWTQPSALPSIAVALALVLAAWFAGGRRAVEGGRRAVEGGRRAVEGGPWRWPFLAVLVGACLAGTLASPAFAIFQVIAFPLAWLLAPGLRSALAVNAAVALAVGVGYAAHDGPAAAVAVEGLSFGFSLAMGGWITRIQHRSDERQAVVERLTAAQAQIAALNRDAGMVAERERLARELHDTLAQSLAGIVMLAERSRAAHPGDHGLAVLEESARQAMAEARGLVTASAGVPMEGGLAAALGVLAERFRRETGLLVDVDAQVEVPRGLEVVLLRCAQEGLANVRKHASARSVSIRVAETPEGATLTITDDGAGPGDGSGFGIAGMRDRLALVGGMVTLSPAAGNGAVLRVQVPLPAEVHP